MQISLVRDDVSLVTGNVYNGKCVASNILQLDPRATAVDFINVDFMLYVCTVMHIEGDC